MKFFSSEKWNKIKNDSNLWWQGELERPLIQIRLKDQKSIDKLKPDCPSYEFTSFYDLSIPEELIIENWHNELEHTIHLGDAFPHVWPNFGPGVIAAFLGAKLENGENTVWFHPDKDLDIQSFEFKINPYNKWFSRIENIYKAAIKRWEGSVQLGMTDLGGNLDIVSTFFPSEKLLLNLYDHSERVNKLTWQAHHLWWQFFQQFNQILSRVNPGYSSWAPIFSEKSSYMLQCDFSYMISPQMFDTFVLPELSETAKRLDNAFYHLDGAGQLPHLDSLLACKDIKGIQWVPGDGAPDVSNWADIYRKINKAGKLTQIFSSQYQGDPFELPDILMDQVGSINNLVYMIDADISQMKKAIELLKKYRVI